MLIKVSEHKDGTEGFTHTKPTQGSHSRKGTESHKSRLDLISWVVCVCMCVRWLIPLFLQEKFTRTDPTFPRSLSHVHAQTHTLSLTYGNETKQNRKEKSESSRGVLLTQRPTSNEATPLSQLFKNCYSSSVHIIYFIYTPNVVSAETSQTLQTLTDAPLTFSSSN